MNQLFRHDSTILPPLRSSSSVSYNKGGILHLKGAEEYIMDGIKQQVHARRSEALENKHTHETRKLNRELRYELDQVKENKTATINDVKKEYDSKILSEKNSLESELIKVRRNNQELIKNEKQRYKNLISEVKAGHESQVAELKNSQEKEIDKRVREHQDSLETLEQKYEEASVQYKA